MVSSARIFLRRAEGNTVEQTGVTVSFYGALDGQTFEDPATVKQFARRAQLGEIFEFDRATSTLTECSHQYPWLVCLAHATAVVFRTSGMNPYPLPGCLCRN